MRGKEVLSIRRKHLIAVNLWIARVEWMQQGGRPVLGLVKAYSSGGETGISPEDCAHGVDDDACHEPPAYATEEWQ